MAAAFVQGAAPTATNTPTTFASNVTAGSLLVCVVNFYVFPSSLGTNVPTVSDNRGNTWQLATDDPRINIDSNCGSVMYYAEYAAAGSTTVTASVAPGPASIDHSVYLGEFSGIALTGALLSADDTTGGSASTTVTGPSLTPVAAGDLIVAGFTHYGTTVTIAPDAADGFTQTCENENGSSLNAGAIQHRVTTSTSALVPNWALGSAEYTVVVGAVFKAAGGGSALTVTITDGLGTTDTATQVATTVRSQTDAAGATDAAAQVVIGVRTETDALGAVDGVAPASVAARVQTDALGATDTAAASFVLSATATDNLGLTDTATRTAAFAPTIIDPLGAVDSTTQAAALERASTDPLGATDTASPAATFIRAQTDGLGATETSSSAGVWARSQVDPLGLTDVAAQVATLAAAVTDALGLTDNAATDASGVLTATITDQLGTTDALAQAAVFVQALVDPLGAADTVVPAGVFDRAQNDALSATDAASRVLDAVRSILDQLGAVDAVTQESSSGLVAVIVDTLGATDSAARVAVTVRSIGEELGATDTADQVAVLARQLVDQLDLDDMVATSDGIQVIVLTVGRAEVAWQMTAASVVFDAQRGQVAWTMTEGAAIP